MSFEMIDKTGELPTLQEVEEMIHIVAKFMRPENMLSLPPELAVNMPSIRRQLLLLHAVLSMKKSPG